MFILSYLKMWDYPPLFFLVSSAPALRAFPSKFPEKCFQNSFQIALGEYGEIESGRLIIDRKETAREH